MSKQAKTLNERELRRVLDHMATRKHAARNRAMLLVTYLAGLRVGETAALWGCGWPRWHSVTRNTAHARSDQRRSVTHCVREPATARGAGPIHPDLA